MKNTGRKKVSWNISHRYLRKCQKFIDVFFQCRVAKKSGLSCERRGYVYVSFCGTREVTKSLMIMLPLQVVRHHYLYTLRVFLWNAQLSFSGPRKMFFTSKLNEISRFSVYKSKMCFQGSCCNLFQAVNWKHIAKLTEKAKLEKQSFFRIGITQKPQLVFYLFTMNLFSYIVINSIRQFRAC